MLSLGGRGKEGWRGKEKRRRGRLGRGQRSGAAEAAVSCAFVCFALRGRAGPPENSIELANAPISIASRASAAPIGEALWEWRFAEVTCSGGSSSSAVLFCGSAHCPSRSSFCASAFLLALPTVSCFPSSASLLGSSAAASSPHPMLCSYPQLRLVLARLLASPPPLTSPPPPAQVPRPSRTPTSATESTPADKTRRPRPASSSPRA